MTEYTDRRHIDTLLAVLVTSAEMTLKDVRDAAHAKVVEDVRVADLAQVGQVIDTLLSTRNALLGRLREQHTSWKAIGAGTGTPTSTWRDRYVRANGGTTAP